MWGADMPQEPNTGNEQKQSQTPSEQQPAPTSVQPTGPATGQDSQPPADAKDTGGTRDSRQKDALELNVEGEQAQRHPDVPAGQHATGSFTDEASKDTP